MHEMTKRRKYMKSEEFPIATVAFYGPDDRHASKVVVGVMQSEDSDVDPIKRWMSGTTDVRNDPKIQNEITAFLEEQGVTRVGCIDRIIGCPHEEGIDYPEGMAKCPMCSFWSNRDRWTGDIEE
jgi:hypothetical protein